MAETPSEALARQLGAQLPLHDIQLPEPIGAWPPAPGWWLLALLLMALIGIGLWRWRRYQRHPATLALKALQQLGEQSDPDPHARAQAYSQLIKRTALSLYPREQVAALSGTAWRTFLCQTTGGEAEVAALQQASLNPAARYDDAAIQRWLKRWLKAQYRRKALPVPENSEVRTPPHV